MAQIFELLPDGFDGNTDTMDDKVIWIRADTAADAADYAIERGYDPKLMSMPIEDDEFTRKYVDADISKPEPVQ